MKYFRLLPKKPLCPAGLIPIFGRLNWCPQGEKTSGKEVTWSAGHKVRVETHGKEKGDSKKGSFGLRLREGNNVKGGERGESKD